MSSRSTGYPSDWQDTTLGALAEYMNGYPFKPRDWTTIGLPIVRIAQMTDESVASDYYANPLPSTYRIDSGDLLFSWSATLLALIWRRGPAYLNLNSEVDLHREHGGAGARPRNTAAVDQQRMAGFNFGEVGICHCKMLAIRGFLVFSPPQLSPMWRTRRRAERPRIAPQVRICVRMVAGSR